MTRKVIKVGSSAAITIPQTLLKKLGLSVGDFVELGDDARGVVIRPVEKGTAKDRRIGKRTTDFIERYRSDLEALARR